MKRFVPDETPTGGTLFGNSYLSSFVNCPLEFFYSYVYPNTNPNTKYKGITKEFTKPALLLGQYFHEGMGSLYRSGCRLDRTANYTGEYTGEWDIDGAVKVMEFAFNQLQDQYELNDRAEKDWDIAETMLRNYYDKYSLRGTEPEYPDIQVVFDGDNKPLIEKSFSIDLGYGGYVYTCRPDLIVTDKGKLKVMEHKTSAYGMWLSKRLMKFGWDSQVTGEVFVLHALFPGEKIEGVIGNVLVKGGKTDKAMRQPATRSIMDIEAFILSAIDTLKQIDERVFRFETDYQKGGDILQCALRHFPDNGTKTGRCEDYGGCQFDVLCRYKEVWKSQVRGFRPRTLEETQASREKTS